VKGETLAGRDLISLLDFDTDELERILEVAAEVKANPRHFAEALPGRTLFMYFEKPSLRTRVTFEAGMTQLGGHAIYYTALHPCQGLADYLTLQEVRGDLKGRRLVYVGDGNNVANSLMFGGARLGVHVTIITPAGFEPEDEVVATARAAAAEMDAKIEVTHDMERVEGADAVYTDVWASMGQEDEAAERKKKFDPYQVNMSVMERAGPDAVFMHCLPAHRGEEVTSDVADMPRSVIFQQAANRLHAQKAVLLLLMGGARS